MKHKFLLLWLTVPFLCNCLANTPLLSSEEKSFHVNKPPLQAIQISRTDSLDLLDKVLSPFEDMTEYALDGNYGGVLNSLDAIKKARSDMLFKSAFETKNYIKLEKKIDLLQKNITHKNYKKIALLSTEIFNDNINNFRYANGVKEQIAIERLDYMGFEILALLYQDNRDYARLDTTLAQTKEVWIALRSKVKDKNIIDSFDLLFKGLQISSKQKNSEIMNIFASLDLALVDVLEKQFQ